MNQDKLLKSGVVSLYFQYLLPAIGATMVTSVYILVDTLMIGRGIGAVGIAALNILLPLFNLFFGLGLLCGVGGSVLFSVFQGRGEKEKAYQSFTGAVVLAAVFSVLCTAGFTVFFEPVTRFLGSTEQVRQEVQAYGRILVLGAPVFIFSSTLQSFVINDRAPRLAMAAVIAGGVLNIILDAVFIFEFSWGMAGAILATVVSSMVTVAILCLRFRTPGQELHMIGKVTLPHCLRILENGCSSFLSELSGGIIIFLFNRQLLRYLGENGLVVYGIVSNCALVVFSLSNGISQAVQPIIAVNYGAGEEKRVCRVRNLGLITALASGGVCTLAGLLRPVLLIYLFVKPTEEIIRLGVPAIKLYFLSFLFTGANILLITCFQSVLEPQKALLLSLMRGLAVNGILVMLLPRWLGVNGIWLTMILTEGITLAAGMFLLYKERRKIK